MAMDSGFGGSPSAGRPAPTAEQPPRR